MRRGSAPSPLAPSPASCAGRWGTRAWTAPRYPTTFSSSRLPPTPRPQPLLPRRKWCATCATRQATAPATAATVHPSKRSACVAGGGASVPRVQGGVRREGPPGTPTAMTPHHPPLGFPLPLLAGSLWSATPVVSAAISAAPLCRPSSWLHPAAPTVGRVGTVRRRVGVREASAAPQRSLRDAIAAGRRATWRGGVGRGKGGAHAHAERRDGRRGQMRTGGTGLGTARCSNRNGQSTEGERGAMGRGEAHVAPKRDN